MTALAISQRKCDPSERQKPEAKEPAAKGRGAEVPPGHEEPSEKEAVAAKTDGAGGYRRPEQLLKESMELIYRKLSDENDYLKKRLQMQHQENEQLRSKLLLLE